MNIKNEPSSFDNMVNAEKEYVKIIEKTFPSLIGNSFLIGPFVSASSIISKNTSISKRDLDSILGADVPEKMVMPIFEASKKIENSILEFRAQLQKTVLEDKGSVYRAQRNLIKMGSTVNKKYKKIKPIKNRYEEWNIKAKKQFFDGKSHYIPDISEDSIVVITKKYDSPLKFEMKYTDNLTMSSIADECQSYFGYNPINCRFSIGNTVYYNTEINLRNDGINAGSVLFCSGS